MLNKQECDKELKILSIEELKEFEGLSDLTDQQAIEIIETLKEISLIAHKIVSHYE
ncbi:hypothetical protein [uncultured Aquimarina sp.]|uniref:hypothetical protein n=1 Tax=uncultured Aquimarina sp. TaxID=575652 RepID=UPI002619A3DD|nr:hypothetical protein [uncultured Aquimarina sp.]